ncbi:uncharacterized protein LOC111114747 isoform X3 [Crassostrea virginica]
MALHQAQALAAAKYKLILTIPLPQHTNIVDLAHMNQDTVYIVYISVKSTAGSDQPIPNSPKYFLKERVIPMTTEVLSYNGDYIVIDNSRCQRTSVFHHRAKVWSPTEEKSDQTDDYTPQGVVATRSGAILICLWNNKVGKRSLGKVVSAYKHFEIFTDKNQPLFICPTYIAENGNGDICVSDVGAVVVTDAGGMLRFRYQGISANSNFEPYGLCCNSACNIIIADMKNDQIHVIDKDGGFLNTVQYEGIKMPRALCIDEEDNVYVGEWNTDSIKVLSC